jgi:hypothetical protein
VKLLKLTILSIFLSPFILISQEITKDIEKGFALGNSDLISQHTAEIVELIVPDQDGSLSKDRANKKLAEFFNQFKSLDFEIVHRGNVSEEADYLLGELKTEENIFSVYILYTGKDIKRISEIRIERDE